MIYHAFTDIRPQISSKKIYVLNSSKDGFLKVAVDPASLKSYTYMAYLVNGSNNNTACGVKLG